MCDAILPSDDLNDGEVLVLCNGDRVDHMLAWLEFPEESDSARRLFESFTHAAKCVVMEEFYFDIDYRSEVALLQATQFSYVEPSVDRIHFFSVSYRRGESLHQYVSRMRTLATSRELDARAVEPKTERRQPKPETTQPTPTPTQPPVYLGYSTVRPRREAKIGRSLVSPWTQVPFRAPTNLKGEDLEHPFNVEGGALSVDTVHGQVRTGVPEHVSLFGVDFRVVGVPFMEQDGNLLRCAHVSAWICHYNAVLRGLSSRRTTSQLHLAGNTTNAIARPSPSSGLSTTELAMLLRSVNLAPEVLTFTDLSEPRSITWADRLELRTRDKKASQAQLGDDPSDHQRLWLEENLSATVCRYLNSGLPVILARSGLGTGHTQVVVGYLRASDLGVTAKGDDSHSDVVAFIVSDDQEGPFELVYVQELVDEFAKWRLTRTQLVVPLPESVWVASDMAERIGTAQILRTAKSRLRRIRYWKGVAAAERSRSELALRDFVTGLTPKPSRPDRFSVRTYVSTGTDFKRSAASRMEKDKNLVAALSRVQLPRFVWVCEVIDRSLRSTRDRPAVVATAVLDTTQLISEQLDSDATDDLAPLFIHIPTQYFAPPVLQTTETDDRPRKDGVVRIGDGGSLKTIEPRRFTGPAPAGKDRFWRTTKIGPYYTGRWSHERLNAQTSAELMGNAKTSVV